MTAQLFKGAGSSLSHVVLGTNVCTGNTARDWARASALPLSAVQPHLLRVYCVLAAPVCCCSIVDAVLTAAFLLIPTRRLSTNPKQPRLLSTLYSQVIHFCSSICLRFLADLAHNAAALGNLVTSA